MPSYQIRLLTAGLGAEDDRRAGSATQKLPSKLLEFAQIEPESLDRLVLGAHS